MPVVILSGKMGSGKSYEAMDKYILPALRKNRRVYTNLEIEPEQIEFIASMSGHSLDSLPLTIWPHFKYDWVRANLSLTMKNEKDELVPSTVEQNSLVVIDETQNIYGSKDWQVIPRHFDQWLGQVRHWGIDVILLTQNPKRVYKGIQTLPPSFIWRFKNLGFFGVPSKYSAKCFLELGYLDLISTQIRKYDKNVFRCYKSIASDKVKRNEITEGNIFTSKKALITYAIFIAGFVWILSHNWFDVPALAENSEVPSDIKTVDIRRSDMGPQAPVLVEKNSPGAPVSTPPAFFAPEKEVVPVSVSVIAIAKNDEVGFVLYSRSNRPGVQYRSSLLEFDRLCRCKTSAKIQAGDMFDL